MASSSLSRGPALALGLSVVAAVGSLTGCAENSAHEAHMEYRWRASDPFEPLPTSTRVPPGRAAPDESLEIRVTVPQIADDDPALDVSWPIPLTGASVGERELLIDQRHPGLFPLLSSDQGQTLTLRYRGPARPLPGPIHFGSQRALWLARLRSDLPSIVVGIMLAAVALLLAVLSLRRRAPELRALALFGLCAGGLAIGQSPVFRSVIWGGMSDVRVVNAAFAIGLPIGLAHFAVAVFGDTRRGLLRLGAHGMTAVCALEACLHLSGIADLTHTRKVDQALLVPMFATILARIGPRARRGDRPAGLFLLGLAALLLGGVPDIAWGLGYPLFDRNTTPFGLLAFTIALGFVVRAWQDAQQQALSSSRAELEQRVHELEVKRRDVEALNDELRWQIGKRSRELRALLTQSSPLSSSRSFLGLSPGEIVDDRYRVVHKLGAGAMGAVYDVERATDGKRFALKVMTGAADAQHTARFAREAEVAARVKHPNVVAIADVGVDRDGVMFLVMERVVGRSLEETRPSFGDVRGGLEILLQVARGLAALHERGVVHRDLKPSNILLEEQAGQPTVARVADLGVARDLADAVPYARTISAGADLPPLSLAETGKADLTAAGAIVGTPLYIAPELAAGTPAGPQADVFAFGILAWEVLTGEYPFVTPPLLHALGRGAPLGVACKTDAIPAAARDLLLRAVAWQPAERPTALEIEASLETLLGAAREPRPKSSPPRFSWGVPS